MIVKSIMTTIDEIIDESRKRSMMTLAIEHGIDSDKNGIRK